MSFWVFWGQNEWQLFSNQPEKRRGKKEERDERERSRPWREKREKPCPGWRRHERRALVGTDGKRALEKRA
ncbi:hypothetical protein TNCV_4167231 [Trichonephila clavipes]|nr:hypothetical protein TNCV_4167231 [Trichonephila clavipes]